MPSDLLPCIPFRIRLGRYGDQFVIGSIVKGKGQRRAEIM